MATPGTCCTLDHCFQSLSINQGSSSPSRSFAPISKDDENNLQRCSVEQFLDLKTGELCYYDWSAGRKTKNDPTQLLSVPQEKAAERPEIEELSTSSEEEEDDDDYDDDDDDDNSDDSESMDEDSQESPFPSPKEVSECAFGGNGDKDPTVLVAAGCQSCLMYYMLPKYVLHCPKCGTAVLHFNEPESAATTSKGKEIEETETD